jgi:hypothetical protein
MARSRRNDAWDDDVEDDNDRRRKPARPGYADALGAAGLVFGVLAALCLLLGVVTCGLTFFLVAPLALVGTGCSAYGRGVLRVAGLILNVLVLIPGLALFGLMVFGIGDDWFRRLAQGN